MVDFTVTCASANACFGRPPTGTNGLEIGWKYLRPTCVPNTANGTFRLKVEVRMRVDNGETSLIGNKWASGMRAEARLEPVETGLQYTRQWRGKAVRPLLPEKSYDERLTLVTDNVSSLNEWRLHVRLVWEIPLARDVTREFISPVSKPVDC